MQIKEAIHWLATGIEICAALLVAIGVAQALIGVCRIPFNRESPETKNTAVRLQLGRWLMLALEFELAADIVLTAFAPTWDEIGQLAAVAGLRTALNFFLQREIAVSESGSAEGRSAARPSAPEFAR